MDPSLARRRSVVTEQPARAAAGAILRRRRGGSAREVEGIALGRRFLFGNDHWYTRGMKKRGALW